MEEIYQPGMNEKIKVAMVEPVGGHRGNDFYDFGLCKAVNDLGTDITLYTCDETNLHLKHKFNFDVQLTYKKIYGNEWAYFRGIRYLIGAFSTIKKAVNSKANVVHFHIYHFANREFINFFLFKRKGFKIVATIHDVEDFVKYGKKINRKKYGRFQKRIDQVIVHSSFAKEQVLHYFEGFNEKNVHIVPHGDSDFLYNKPIHKFDARNNLNLPANQDLILFFGQIKKVKGLDVLLHAFVKVRNQRKNTKLLIVGSPWKVEWDQFETIIRENKLEDDCILKLDYVANEIVPQYYAASDLVILPYRKIYSSGVMIRSLDYEAAIIASDLDTFRKIINDGENGVLFESENAEDLAKKILELIDNKEKIAKLKVEAKKTAQSKFSWELIGKKVNDIYRLAYES